MSRVPPRRLFALPIEETVMSMVWPGWAKAGSEVVTITAATFFSCSWPVGGRFTPFCCSMAMIDCTVNGVWLVWSPVPSRPTTRP